jgi:RNA 2',3'-cyclic 3'-phosphodiesterase
MRLFIASTFPPEIIRALSERVDRVRTKLPQASWVRPDSQHLTYAFLGEQDESIVAKLELPRLKSFDATLRGCGFFPNPRRARVGWVGVDPPDAFCETAAAVRETAAKAGVQLDRADFKPHLTLVRIRDSWPPACIDIFQKALGDFASPSFHVDKVTLYSSELNPKGAIHTALKQFALVNM